MDRIDRWIYRSSRRFDWPTGCIILGYAILFGLFVWWSHGILSGPMK